MKNCCLFKPMLTILVETQILQQEKRTLQFVESFLAPLIVVTYIGLR